MRVLKIAKINNLFRFTCTKCDALLEVARAELKYEIDDREDGVYTFKCCACKAKNWVAPVLVDK